MHCRMEWFQYKKNKIKKESSLENLLHRKKYSSLCSLWIFEGNICNLRLLIHAEISEARIKQVVKKFKHSETKNYGINN